MRDVQGGVQTKYSRFVLLVLCCVIGCIGWLQSGPAGMLFDSLSHNRVS